MADLFEQIRSRGDGYSLAEYEPEDLLESVGAADAAKWVYVGHGEFDSKDHGGTAIESDPKQHAEYSYLMPRGTNDLRERVYVPEVLEHLDHRLAAVWVSACVSVKGAWQDFVAPAGQAFTYRDWVDNIAPFSDACVVTAGRLIPAPYEISLPARH